MGILTRVTGRDLLIRTLMVMILDNKSLITPERVRVFAFQERLCRQSKMILITETSLIILLEITNIPLSLYRSIIWPF
jgi:hypothetical protein